jgi:hypothetical protein
MEWVTATALALLPVAVAQTVECLPGLVDRVTSAGESLSTPSRVF